jgi:AraC family transcriptional regulator
MGQVINDGTGTLANGAFYGRARQPLQVGGVTLAETTYDAGFLVPLHDHAHPILCLALAGGFTEHVGRSRAVLGPRSVFFQPAGEAHAETFHDQPSRLFNMQLGDDWLRGMAGYDVRLPEVPVNVARGRLTLLAGQLHAEYRLRADALRLAVDGILLSMLAELTRATLRRERSRRSAWLDTVIAVLHERFRESIGLAELAAIVQVDPSHIARTFRARMGCTIGEYVRALRVEHARRLLATTDVPLSRAALLSGFSDQSHMTREFRASLGVTPGVYRRSSR